MKKLSILVAGSLANHAHCGLAEHLKSNSFQIQELLNTREVLQSVKREHPQLVIMSLEKKFEEQLRLLKEIRLCNDHIPIIMFVNTSSENQVIAALRAGVSDYIKPPFTLEAVMCSIERCHQHSKSSVPSAIDQQSLVPENLLNSRLVGTTSEMQALRKVIEQMAHTDVTVLITGETGTGKELVAEFLHQRSPRHKHPLTSINCAAIPDSLLESELFGYQRGAFTGADTAYEGKLQEANGGSVFLDEIGDMSLQAQAKLLRVIENKEVCPLGGRTGKPLDVRLLTATNQDLESMIRAGTFRKDLFYRVNVAQIHLPPLRERQADIPLLVAHFLRLFNNQYGRTVHGVTNEAMEIFLGATWPGNVRELKSCMELALLNCPGDEIMAAHLPASVQSRARHRDVNVNQEEHRLLAVLTATKWNITAAARELHWSRMTLYRKLARYNISKKKRDVHPGDNTKWCLVTRHP